MTQDYQKYPLWFAAIAAIGPHAARVQARSALRVNKIPYAADPGIDGARLFSEHLKTHNHQSSDDLGSFIDRDSALRFVRANVRIGYAIAGKDERPVWNDGDFFGEKFRR